MFNLFRRKKTSPFEEVVSGRETHLNNLPTHRNPAATPPIDAMTIVAGQLLKAATVTMQASNVMPNIHIAALCFFIDVPSTFIEPPDFCVVHLGAYPLNQQERPEKQCAAEHYRNLPRRRLSQQFKIHNVPLAREI